MCLNKKWIVNRYTGAKVLVNCGECEACQQEKAARRATRIRNNNAFGTLCLFVTLTYDRLSCPVVFRDDVELRRSHLNVYRLNKVRRVRMSASYNIGLKRKYELTKIGVIDDIVYDSEMENFSIPKLAHLNRKYVGICWYKDVQDFFKRLRRYVDYHLPENENKLFSWFTATEYGESTFRPHVHSLLFVPSHLQEFYKKAVVACWPFADRRRTTQYVQVARDAASYVASYVNCGSDFPSVYRSRPFRQKCVMSKNFGVGLDCFQLSKVLEKVSRRDLSYNIVTHKDGVLGVRTVALPYYVINRFFPKYKGYGFYSDMENRDFISSAFKRMYVPPQSTYECLTYGLKHGVQVDEVLSCQFGIVHLMGDSLPLKHFVEQVFERPRWSLRNHNFVWSPDELREYQVMIENAYEYYHSITGKNRYDYAIDFVETWNCYKSTCMRLFYADAELNNYQDTYDNISDWYIGNVRSVSLDDYQPLITSLDPNEFDLNKQKHFRLVDTYNLKKKTRKVTNIAMAANGHWV